MNIEFNFLQKHPWVYYNPVQVFNAFETTQLGTCHIVAGPVKRFGILCFTSEKDSKALSKFIRCNYFIAETGVAYIESFVLTEMADMRFPTVRLKKQMVDE